MPPMTQAETYARIAELAAGGETFAVATVVATHRSAPREAGAKMIVFADRRIEGTVGGGPLEGQVILEAARLLAEGGESCKLSYELRPDVAESLGMKCGGDVEVFIEAVRPRSKLLILGGGHVGERTARVAVEAGLDVTVVDDREEFSAKDRFPGAREVRRVDLRAEPTGGVAIGPRDAIVIVTRCHELDEGCLEGALRTAARYVGLIGSRRKVATILRSIEQRTGMRPRQDSRLYAPIGLVLGDKTPGAIAVSIVAEVLKVLSGADGGHHRLPLVDVAKNKSA